MADRSAGLTISRGWTTLVAMRLLVVAAVASAALIFSVAHGQGVREPSADLALQMTDSPDPVRLGDKLTYTLTVINRGPDTAEAVTMSASLPPNGGHEVSSGSPPTRCSGTDTTTTCSFGPITSGATRTMTIVIRPRRAGAGAGSATVSSSTRDPDPSNNAARVTTRVNAPFTIVNIARGPRTPRAGEKFFIAIHVVRNDTGATVETGKVECTAKIGRRAVRLLLREPYPTPRCLWRIPFGSSGKVLRGSIGMRSGGKAIVHRFALKIR